jgi:predicted dehydrogenase
MTDQFRNFCIVGIGGHARTKLIPAIETNGQAVTAVVSSQSARGFAGTAVFSRLEEAIEKLPRDTAFFIATPPALHFEQTRLVLQGGFDVFVEKPAFVGERDAQEIVALCEARSLVLVEGFMHRYTRLYAELLDVLAALHERVRRIEIEFLIPEMPAGTFRSERAMACSTLFDIGCYPVSLLDDLGLGDARLAVSGVQFADNPDKTRIRVTGSAGKIAIGFDIGVGAAYTNAVVLHLGDGEIVSFAPFFYGRKADRAITTSSAGKSGTRTFHDENSFEAMLARPRAAWLADQAARSCQMVAVAGRLEQLANALRAAP